MGTLENGRPHNFVFVGICVNILYTYIPRFVAQLYGSTNRRPAINPRTWCLVGIRPLAGIEPRTQTYLYTGWFLGQLSMIVCKKKKKLHRTRGSNPRPIPLRDCSSGGPTCECKSFVKCWRSTDWASVAQILRSPAHASSLDMEINGENTIYYS